MTVSLSLTDSGVPPRRGPCPGRVWDSRSWPRSLQSLHGTVTVDRDPALGGARFTVTFPSFRPEKLGLVDHGESAAPSISSMRLPTGSSTWQRRRPGMCLIGSVVDASPRQDVTTIRRSHRPRARGELSSRAKMALRRRGARSRRRVGTNARRVAAKTGGFSSVVNPSRPT